MIILETERLILRHLILTDLEDLYALYCDSDITKYIPDAPKNYQETRDELEWHMNGHPRHPELGLWATIDKATNQFIGRCGLLPWTVDGIYEVEVAYTIRKDHWGQGLGSEAAKAILDYGFEKLHLTRLICLIDHDNLASKKVATKIGMTFEKDWVDKLGLLQVYSINQE
ncbi:MAG: GNAT family N-acetyltransferase [Anaerolineaceae bacterium]